MVDDIAEASYWAYRERFLYEKSGNTGPIVIDAEVMEEHEDPNGDEAPLDVVDILKSEGIEVEDED
jgi:hypothetical protein